MTRDQAGQAYFVQPDTGPGPGVLIMHSWWGLTPFFRRLADRLAEAGYTAVAPDLLGGEQPATPAEAEELLGELNPDETVRLVSLTAGVLAERADADAGGIGVIGFSMGASLAMWLAARAPELVDATVLFYGTQSMDLVDSQCAFLGHFAEYDSLVPDDEVNELEAGLRLDGHDVTFHRYPGTSHWFFEEDRVPAYDSAAAEVAWDRTLGFLRERLTAVR